jgi:hypothetical protein
VLAVVPDRSMATALISMNDQVMSGLRRSEELAPSSADRFPRLFARTGPPGQA